MDRTQQRVDNYTIATRQWRIVGLTPHDWVVVSLALPQDVRDDMMELERYRATLRGGMQDVHYIRYKHASDPIRTYLYEFRDTYAVLAEMVCDFAVDMLCAPHHILFLRSTHVPSLDELLVSLEGVVLYLVDMRFIHYWTEDDVIMWTPAQLEKASEIQRAEIMDESDNKMPRPCLMPSMPRGQPVSYQPVPRGGCCTHDPWVPRHQDGAYVDHRGGVRDKLAQNPRQQVMAWAIDKVRAHAPQAEGPTLKMLLKAEARTATSLMNSKSPPQTREILTAAWKRAGLQSPFDPAISPTSSSPEASQIEACNRRMDDMATALLEQVKITQQIADTLQELPRIPQFEAIMTSMNQAQTSYVQTIGSLADSIGKLERRIEAWETSYLPHLIERLPAHAMPTPESEETDEDDIGGSAKRPKISQDTMPYDDVKASENHVGQETEKEKAPSEEPREQVSPFEAMRERSLRRCCTKVVEAQQKSMNGG